MSENLEVALKMFGIILLTGTGCLLVSTLITLVGQSFGALAAVVTTLAVLFGICYATARFLINKR